MCVTTNLRLSPDSIGLVANLKTLDLCGNRLTILPNSTGSLTNLTRLDLCGNRLSSLSISLGSLTKLKHLDISCNKLDEIPFELVPVIEHLGFCFLLSISAAIRSPPFPKNAAMIATVSSNTSTIEATPQ